LTGTPVAGDIVVCPGIQIKPVESHALAADRDFSDMRPHLSVESVAVHAQVHRGIAQAQQSWEQGATAVPAAASHPAATQTIPGVAYTVV